MRLRYRLLSVILVLLMLSTCMWYALSEITRQAQGTEAALTADRSALTSLGDVLTDTKTLRLWYTDPALTEYLNYVAVAWHEEHDNVRLRPELVSAIEYLEAIQMASTDMETPTPDLYLTTNDTLEKAYLAGMASKVVLSDAWIKDNNYQDLKEDAAWHAVTYHGDSIAYPYYFESAALLYNRSYLEAAAKDTLEDEKLQAGEALVGTEVPITEEEITERMNSYLPKTIADIMTFADSYNAPDTVEAVFRWDVNDVFNNYFFIGEYMNVGGASGDDIAQIDIYNRDAISGMQIFQQMNQFFAIDADEVNSDTIIEDFITGKTVFTLATTDAVRRIAQAQASGDCIYEYGAVPVPDLTEELNARPLSVTNCIVVNGYTEHPKIAHEIAQFMLADAWAVDPSNTHETGDAMMRMSGKCAAGSHAIYGNPMYEAYYESYVDSVPMSKMLETANLWIYLEIAFTDVWNGADANDTLRALSEQIMTQIAGESYTEKKISDPPLVTIEADEDN